MINSLREGDNWSVVATCEIHSRNNAYSKHHIFFEWWSFIDTLSVVQLRKPAKIVSMEKGIHTC